MSAKWTRGVREERGRGVGGGQGIVARECLVLVSQFWLIRRNVVAGCHQRCGTCKTIFQLSVYASTISNQINAKASDIVRVCVRERRSGDVWEQGLAGNVDALPMIYVKRFTRAKTHSRKDTLSHAHTHSVTHTQLHLFCVARQVCL